MNHHRWWLMGLACAPGVSMAVTGPDGRWAPGLGDPTPLGWITVLAYAGVAVSCARLAWRRVPPAWFWWALTLMLIFLTLNKQLDLQSWLTQWGRDMARRDGWYAQRHAVQRGFIWALLLVSVGAAGVMLALLWRHWQRVWLVALGGLSLAVFVVVRAASFHHVDLFLMAELGGVRWNGLIELGSLGLMAGGCALAARRSRR